MRGFDASQRLRRTLAVIFSHVSAAGRGWCRSRGFEDTSHELLGFLSGVFRRLQLRQATVDEGGLAIVSTFQQLKYLLWCGIRIYAGHRNLAYVLHPGGV